MPRIDLQVPFNEKDAAKRLGARWDGDGKIWYVPEGVDARPFSRWLASQIGASQHSRQVSNGVSQSGAAAPSQPITPHEPTPTPPPPGRSPEPVPAEAPPAYPADDPETRAILQALESEPNLVAASFKDSPHAILSSWLAQEVLTAATYKEPSKLADDDRSRVARIDTGALPWQRGESSRPKLKLFYLVVFGEIEIDNVMPDLLRQFGDDEESPRRQGTRAPIAMAVVDRDGFVLPKESTALCSFAWGIPVVLRDKLGSLGRWPEAETIVLSRLHERLIRSDVDGNSLPLDLVTIHGCHNWLVNIMGLRPDQVNKPNFVLRLYQSDKSNKPPELPLLNSFYLKDLIKARSMVDAGTAPVALLRYLGEKRPAPGGDLLTDHAQIAELVAPSRFPQARWPSPGGHPLVTLQQAAVNTAHMEFQNGKEGILAVNGPPGTGKTTLLRDLVAHCVASRAEQLVKFEDPEDAFIQTGEQIRNPNGSFMSLYGLDPKIKGFELLVASSNNKAVENVSKELPARKSIASGVAYFPSIAKVVYTDPDAPPDDSQVEPWGLVAAVLGNSNNRKAFRDAFWWNKEYGFQIYLQAAQGKPVARSVPDGEGKPPRMEIPAIVLEEHPLTGPLAKQQWKNASKAFTDQQCKVKKLIADLEAARALPKQFASAMAHVDTLNGEYSAFLAAKTEAEQAHGDAQAAADKAQSDLTRLGHELNAMQAVRPGFFARLFRTSGFKDWTYRNAIKQSEHRSAQLTAKSAVTRLREAENSRNLCTKAYQEASDKLAQAQKTLTSLSQALKAARARLGERFVDQQFFTRGHGEWNLSAPWLDDAVHMERETLFALALNVHKAFVTVAAQKVQHNIGVLMNAMQAGALPDQGKRLYLGDLWSTLFLVVPVVSTTFASVDRMLGDVGTGSFGWLLIDEAGQATPQACIGALLRSRRVVVVGDPLQIPPVVSVPEKLISSICQHYGVQKDMWSAPEASVQTVADAATGIKARFSTESGFREVGMPLLVHRRCQEPMFGVSNATAYNQQMVHAAGAGGVGPVGQVLGKSVWFDVQGSADSKWCPEEGQMVLDLLSQLAESGVRNPDVYVITPFRNVSFGLKQMLRDQKWLFQAFGIQDMHKWLEERVGTIHTFQGKEAEAVIAVLGAPMSNQAGARQWAGNTPNILNVMVTRSKSRLYVVGSYSAWRSVGYFAELAKRIPFEQSTVDSRHE